MNTAVLVVAKMPVPGEAKTRLAEYVGEAAAADLAAAALLDTLDAVAASGLPGVVACTGDVGGSSRRRDVMEALSHHVVVRQRGCGFAERLVAAHHDAARLLPGHRVLQIGMDTPQVSVDLLETSARLLESHEAVLGAAGDGGWWALGVRDPELTLGLVDVPMSAPGTGEATLTMLETRTTPVGLLPELTDVDTVEDAFHVAGLAHCGPRFAAAANALRAETA